VKRFLAVDNIIISRRFIAPIKKETSVVTSAGFSLFGGDAAFRAEVYLDVRFLVLVVRFLATGFLALDGAFLATLRAGLAAGLDLSQRIRKTRPTMTSNTISMAIIAGR
jgi:hypothetical protein